MAWRHDRPEGLLDASAKCFRLAGALDLLGVAEAQLAAVRALDCVRADPRSQAPGKASASASGGAPSLAGKQMLLAAAARCLVCRGPRRLPWLAARLLTHAHAFEASGKVFAALGCEADSSLLDDSSRRSAIRHHLDAANAFAKVFKLRLFIFEQTKFFTAFFKTAFLKFIFFNYLFFQRFFFLSR
jgi:hypothetical protein